MSYKEMEITIPNTLNEDTAVVVSKDSNDNSHYAWYLDGKIIAVEYNMDYGMGIFAYKSLGEYLDEMENSWVLKNNEVKETFSDLKEEYMISNGY